MMRGTHVLVGGFFADVDGSDASGWVANGLMDRNYFVILV